jgi:hypothetical protein
LRISGVTFRSADDLPSDLKTIGFAVCCIAFAVFGAAVRVVAERRAAEPSWWETARRLWSIQTNKSRGSMRKPDNIRPPVDRDRDFDKSAA